MHIFNEPPQELFEIRYNHDHFRDGKLRHKGISGIGPGCKYSSLNLNAHLHTVEAPMVYMTDRAFIFRESLASSITQPIAGIVLQNGVCRSFRVHKERLCVVEK